ncbi:MAG TPA: hemerythrin domain-containing protein [Pilimelia sp.]|nr:hemerythrin domain-containing protein [Pilimelia sp.]
MTVPLPPLPPLGGDGAFWEPAGRSVIDVLDGEHRRMAALCAWLLRTRTPGRRREVADVVTATVVRHLSAEEQYLYPAVRAVLPDGDALADREIAEDRVVFAMLRELGGTPPTTPTFDRLAARLADHLERHARVGGDDLLGRLRGAASDEELVRLGNRVQVAQEAAPTRPHPNTPATPPWNKLVDPALGLLDKARDAVARRSTYPRDL